jgi:hypothetical protein
MFYIYEKIKGEKINMEDKIKEILNKFYNIEEEGLDSIDFENYAGTHYSSSVKITNISQKDNNKVEVEYVYHELATTTDAYGVDIGAYNDFKKTEECVAIVDTLSESIISLDVKKTLLI